MKKILFFISTLLYLSNLSMTYSQEGDWANLAKYATENEKVNEMLTKKHRVVFMGNSITEGWSQASPEFFAGKPYINRGISGQTTPQMLIRFRPDVIDLAPETVIILAGTNDIAGNTGPMTLEEIMGNIKSMAELADANGIKVVLCSVLPAYDYPWRPGLHPDEKIPMLNQMIKDYCKEKKFTYLDYFSEMADQRNGMKEGLASDEVHPTKKGYEVMEKMVTKLLNHTIE